MAEDQTAQTMGDPGRASRRGGRQPDSLLVIDDDLSICTMLEKIGEKAGFAVKHAVSLEEATALLRMQQFACITLDLGLGANSGVEMLHILAGMGCTTPIIIISASQRSMRDFAAEIGDRMRLDIRPPFGKPIDFVKLKATLVEIKEMLNLQRRADSAA
jgi:DNA-binding NtrC family response regulator